MGDTTDIFIPQETALKYLNLVQLEGHSEMLGWNPGSPAAEVVTDTPFIAIPSQDRSCWTVNPQFMWRRLIGLFYFILFFWISFPAVTFPPTTSYLPRQNGAVLLGLECPKEN